jgi:hypothetical protein
MNTLSRQHFPRKLKTGQNIVPFQIGKLGQHLLHRIAPGQIFKDAFDRITQTTDTGLPMTNFRINRDAREQTVVRHESIVQILAEDAKTIS